MKKEVISYLEPLSNLLDTICDLKDNSNISIRLKQYEPNPEYSLINEPKNLSEEDFNLYIEPSELSRWKALSANDLNFINFVLSKRNTLEGYERVTTKSFIKIFFDTIIYAPIHPFDARTPKTWCNVISRVSKSYDNHILTLYPTTYEKYIREKDLSKLKT